MPRFKTSQLKSKTYQWDLPPGSHVWLYLRHSPGDNQTIYSQVSEMHKWCLSNEWIIDREFIDEAQEGSKEERQLFQEMIALSRQQPRLTDGIVIWSFSRFARDQLDAQFYKADLRKRGFVVLSKVDDIPNNDVAPIIEAVVDWKNQRFLEDLSVDVKRGHTFLVEQGFWPVAKPPIGYTLEKVEIGMRPNGTIRYGNRLIKDETVADRVALAWKMKMEQNASYLDIYHATHLYSVPTHYDCLFKNMLYIGVFVFRGKRYPENWEDGGHFVEPYITLQDFELVQENRRKRSITEVAPRTLASRYLLSGLLQCGICAQNGKHVSLVGGSGGLRAPEYFYYRCGTKIRERGSACNLARKPCWRIDEAVIRIVKQTVLTPEYVQAELERASQILNHSQSDMQNQYDELFLKVERQRKEVEHLIGLITKKGMTATLERLYDQANQGLSDSETRLAVVRATYREVDQAYILREVKYASLFP
ncbi:MAG: recombinase family protein [Ktedonobacteraceae bacterium]|nr:recombinase family protein [Ktedonobacteraceae bacterium]MBA3826132.1 recombinase family protein [Ktedonobacterales bacterium]